MSDKTIDGCEAPTHPQFNYDDRDHCSQLMFLETCAVDRGGRVDVRSMNTSDFKLTETWAITGLVQFGRICFKDCTLAANYWVELNEQAWAIAHHLRKARAFRLLEVRDYLRTSER